MQFERSLFRILERKEYTPSVVNRVVEKPCRKTLTALILRVLHENLSTTVTFIWIKNTQGYFSWTDYLGSLKVTVFREVHFGKTARFSKQRISTDKYSLLFSCQIKVIGARGKIYSVPGVHMVEGGAKKIAMRANNEGESAIFFAQLEDYGEYDFVRHKFHLLN